MRQLSLLSLLNKLSNQEDSDLFAFHNVENIHIFLETVSSKRKMQNWAKYHQLSVAELYDSCLAFLSLHIQNNRHDSYRVLFTDKNMPKANYLRHYRLLMNIFHPDKSRGGDQSYESGYHNCVPLIITAYKQLREESRKKAKLSLKSDRNNSNLSKKVHVDSLYGSGQKVKIKLKKIKKPKKKLHVHLIVSSILICFAFFLITYIFSDNSVTTGFYKKTIVTAKGDDESRDISRKKSNAVKHINLQYKALNSTHND